MVAPMVFALGRLRQELCEFQAIMDCAAEFYVKKNQNNNYKSQHKVHNTILGFLDQAYTGACIYAPVIRIKSILSWL